MKKWTKIFLLLLFAGIIIAGISDYKAILDMVKLICSSCIGLS